MSAISDIFNEFQHYIDEEQDIREEIRLTVRDLEQKGRELLTTLQGIHQPEGFSNIPALCEAAAAKLADVKAGYAKLDSRVPSDQYYRFNDCWRFITQRLCFLSALQAYLTSEKLLTRQQCADILGVRVERGEGFHLDIEDYLMGVLQLASELSRLAVNSVTSGDCGRPIRIARFLTDLDLGFRLLNLKNDALRKRFDGLKYDLKKVEEVVYDITIRGLKPTTDESPPPPAGVESPKS